MWGVGSQVNPPVDPAVLAASATAVAQQLNWRLLHRFFPACLGTRFDTLRYKYRPKARP